MTVDPTGDRTGAAAMLQRWVTAAVPATPQDATPHSGRLPISSPCSPDITCCVRCATKWESPAGCGTTLAVHRDLPHAACGAAALQRARGEVAARPVHPHRLSLLCRQSRAVLAVSILHLGTAIVARVFYVWVAVFSLFALAVFWSFMADIFTADQGKRLFGFIGAGGTAGALLGPVITIWLSVPLGPVNLLIPAVILLEAAVFCVWRLERAATAHEGLQAEPQRLGGSAFAALPELVRSPYLFGIAAWITLLSFCATILYLEQIHMVAAGVRGADAQTRVFASVDLAVNLLTLATQILATGQLLKRFGTGLAAAALPAIFVIGFLAVFLAPTLSVVLVAQVAQRWFHFSVATPARQVFYTVLGREEKYKAKNLIDVVIYRGSDALYSWVFDSLQWLGLKLGTIALVAAPMAAVWLILSAALGRAQERRAKLIDAAAAPGE